MLTLVPMSHYLSSQDPGHKGHRESYVVADPALYTALHTHTSHTTFGVRYSPSIDLLMADELSLSASLTPPITTPPELIFDPTSSTM